MIVKFGRIQRYAGCQTRLRLWLLEREQNRLLEEFDSLTYDELMARYASSDEAAAIETWVLPRDSSDDAQLLALVGRFSSALSAQLSATNRMDRWCCTHLIAEAYGAAWSAGFDERRRALVVALLLRGVGDRLREVMSRPGATLDDMHIAIELLETTAAAIRNDVSVVDQFASSFADVVLALRDRPEHCLLVWCIGELTERGQSILRVAQIMAEKLVVARPSDSALTALRMVCSRGPLAQCGSLAPILEQARGDELVAMKQRVASYSAAIRKKMNASRPQGAAMSMRFVEELLNDTDHNEPLRTVLALCGARQLLKDTAAAHVAYSWSTHAFIEMSCRLLIESRRETPARSCFAIAETLEPLRDFDGGFFATTMAGLLRRADPELRHGVAICMVEGMESELMAFKSRLSDPPRFTKRLTRTARIVTYDPGQTSSAFTPFWSALAELMSRNRHANLSSLEWINNRLKAYCVAAESDGACTFDGGGYSEVATGVDGGWDIHGPPVPTSMMIC